MDATRRAALAERAARAGGVVAREQFRAELDVETKAHENDFVTETDREAQRQVLGTIRREFPDDALVVEEQALPPGTDPGTVDLRESVPGTGAAWVVDPIDGTGNFVRGIRFWATSVAAVVDGKPVGVATALPAEGDVYAAGPESVTRNGSALSVSDRTDPGTFAVGLVGWWPMRQDGRFAGLVGAAGDRFGDLRRLGSMQGTLALVADGGLEAAVTPASPHPWDALAGVHLVRRAGGTATDLRGNPWRHDSEGLVVSNGTAHDAVLASVREAAASGE